MGEPWAAAQALLRTGEPGTADKPSAMRRPRRLAVWLLVAVSVGTGLLFLAVRIVGPSDGGLVPFYGDAWRADGVAVQAMQPSSGLLAGDVVLAIGGRSLGDWIAGAIDPTLDRSLLAGATVTYTVLRGGSLRQVEVAYTPHDIAGLLLDNWSNILFAVVMLGTGLYVLWRRPELSASVALVIAGCGVAGSILPWLLGLQTSDIALGWPLLMYVFAASALYMLLWPAGALHLGLALAGQPARRTLVAIYAIPLAAYVLVLLTALLLSPSLTAWFATWPLAQNLIAIPTVVVGLGLATRLYRSASAHVRRQVRWATLGAVAATLTGLSLMFVPELLTGRPLVGWNLIGLFALPLPVGVAVGILRYRLFDIDVVVNRTLVYGGATLAVVVVYLAAFVLLRALLPLGGGLPASIFATGLAAVAALPIRDLLQRAVNRVMYGDRDDPYRALTRLGKRLEDSLDPIAAPAVIVRTVAESMRVPWAALQFAGDGGAGRLVEHGQRPAGEPFSVPLVYGAEIVGDLLVARRSPAEPLSQADEQLLAALARQSGAAVHAIALTRDLIESREHLVAAREEERRRIRRDLHDGLGPALAAIGMRAELAADLVARDPGQAGEVLGQLSPEVAAALAEIRRLVDGLRPPSLDESGLIGALQLQADRLGSPPAYTIRAAESLPDLPAAVEVAAYRVCVEAMTNVSRHAAARTCQVELAIDHPHDPDMALRLTIRDDGRGLPQRLRPGIGIASMRQRAAEVGGTCELDSTPGAAGTQVTVVLPLARES